MAELHVQAKKHNSSPVWIWIVIGLLIAAVIIYFVTRNNKADNNTTTTPASTTSGIQLPQQFARTAFIMQEVSV